jgi:hypothetical protein
MSDIKSQEITGKLTHWVDAKDKEAILAGSFQLPQARQTGIANKPQGIWISWNGGWEDFCRDDFTTWMDGKACLRASLAPDLRIWKIDTLEDFTAVWHKFDPENKPDMMLFSKYDHLKDFWAWIQAQGYDGIAMTEQGQWRTRRTTFLYGWDVSSVVIFDRKNVTFTEEPDDQQGTHEVHEEQEGRRATK